MSVSIKALRFVRSHNQVISVASVSFELYSSHVVRPPEVSWSRDGAVFAAALAVPFDAAAAFITHTLAASAFFSSSSSSTATTAVTVDTDGDADADLLLARFVRLKVASNFKTTFRKLRV
jgi:hypothetical protein